MSSSLSSVAGSASESYQVFLSYSRADSQAVIEIAEILKEKKISIWFDKWSMPPGVNYHEEIEKALVTSRTIAVFLGPGGLGNWETAEMQRAINRAITRKAVVIPVLLPGVSATAEWIPELLRSYNFCEMNDVNPTTVDRLIWGITGENPIIPAPTIPKDTDASDPVAGAIDTLAKRLVSGNVTFLFGRSAGQPSSNGDIASKLLETLGLIDAGWDKLLPQPDLAASFYAVKHGDPELEDRVVEFISARTTAPASYAAVARLQKVLGTRVPVRGKKAPKRLIVSNNLDIGLEKALLLEGVPFTRVVQFRSIYPDSPSSRHPAIQINTIAGVQPLPDGRLQISDPSGRVGIANPGDDAALGELISGTGTRTVNVLDGAMKDTNDQTPVSVGDMIEPIIYKLHGSQDVARSCAISTEQYYWALWRLIDQKYIPDELGSIISLTPVVLVGSRILDADFRLTYTLLRSQLVAGNDEKRWAVVPRGGGDDRDLSYKLAKGAWTELCERALEKYSIRMLNESEDVFFRRLTEAFLARR